MSVLLDEERFAEELHSYEHTAFRLELQRAYSEPSEADTVSRFLADDPQEPTELSDFLAFYAKVAEHVAAGKTFQRVRVHEDPPTPYQRWERWVGRWNVQAGESIRYMTRARAHEIGLLPGAGADDWWLLDSNRLIVMRFDDHGHRLRNELTVDPGRVVQACAWRDLAVHHSVPENVRNPAA